MRSLEAEGASIDEAIARAVAQLGVAREQIEIEILANATRGFLGFGAAPARVRATLRVAAGADQPAAPTPPAAPAGSPSPSPSRAAAAAVSPQTVARAQQVLREIVRLTGVPATVEVDPAAPATLVIAGDPSGVLIGRGGRTLDALEMLVNRIAADGEEARVRVDAHGYRARQQAKLEEQARHAAARARRSGRPQSLPPLPPRERRIVHLALRDDAGVTTASRGSGHLRQVVIAPAARRRRADPDG